MPIINIQRRMAEQGRIRLGQKVTGTSREGKTYTRPEKLDRFRFTSPSERLVAEVASLYGGNAQPWDNDGKAEHEVITDARSIPVIVVKGGFSQWHEFWTRGGCKHRCDGEKDPAGTFCDPQDPEHLQAIEKPTTRLSVMLAEVETLGVWRMESKGWNAAAELPSMAELAMHVGDLVPATLSLADRSSIIEVKGKPQTSRYVVPVLDLHVTKKRLVELVGGVGGVPMLEAPAQERAALEESRPDYLAELAAIDDLDECRALWTRVKDAGHMTPDLHEAITLRADQLKNAAVVADESGEGDWPDDSDQPTEQAPIDEPVDAEVVEDEQPATDPGADPRAVVWQQLLAKAGTHGLGFDETRSMVEKQASLPLAECTVEHLQAALHTLTTGEVPEAVSA
ncbi:hypothetical protein ACI3EY_07870 [Ornithinimicrobium sp. LYQ92]|uniref:recombination directionality factor n=1 Tax=Serinicoccus sp. LYQ92 TaxID=3378798 RepID=UPI003853103E